MTDILDTAVPSAAIYRFGSPFDRSVGSLPGMYASKSFTGEDASMRVKWRTIVFHGEGTILVRIYVDNVLILPEQRVVMTEMFSQERLINFPRGTSTGYVCRFEYSIQSGYVRFSEIYYDTVHSDVN
jgi:hypothetical protein